LGVIFLSDYPLLNHWLKKKKADVQLDELWTVDCLWAMAYDLWTIIRSFK